MVPLEGSFAIFPLGSVVIYIIDNLSTQWIASDMAVWKQEIWTTGLSDSVEHLEVDLPSSVYLSLSLRESVE